MTEPDEYPFGQTEYLNYDPEQINTPQDVVEVFRWIAEQNEDYGDSVASWAFNDAADLVEQTLAEQGVQE